MRIWFRIYGYGVGIKPIHKIKSILRNIVFLSKTYGCFRVEAINFLFSINSDQLSVIILSSDTSITTSTYIRKCCFYSKITPLALVIALLLASLVHGMVSNIGQGEAGEGKEGGDTVDYISYLIFI